MHRFRIVFSLVVLLLVMPPVALATAPELRPRLELPGSWFAVVEPYRYDEARRFERGWNRGADVQVANGRVRAPVDGRVRFSGDVAGRSVVTIEAHVDGVPVVVTLTGLDRVGVLEGVRVRRGSIVGWGRGVHVGMYDQARRSRYLPVVGVDAGGASDGVASADGAPDRSRPTGSSSLSGALASRLLDAIRGDVARSAPRVQPAAAPSRAAPSTHVVGPTARTSQLAQPHARAGAVPVRVVGPTTTRSQFDRPHVRAGAVPVRVVGLTTTRSQSVQPHARAGAVPRRVVGPATADAQRNQPHAVMGPAVADPGLAGTIRANEVHAEPGVAGHSGPLGPATTTMHGRPATSPRGMARQRTSDTGDVDPRGHDHDVDDATVTSEAADIERVRVRDTAHPPITPGTRDTAAWEEPAVVAVLLVIVMLAFAARTARRRRPAPDAAPRPVRTFPPILPTMHSSLAARVRTDGHSIIGDAPLAWADHEAGTSTHEPELLRHDADLLPERAAAPGPRVHDDRRGRDHPLPAAHGS